MPTINSAVQMQVLTLVPFCKSVLLGFFQLDIIRVMYGCCEDLLKLIQSRKMST